MQGLLRVISALPLGFHYAWAGFFAWLLRDVMHYRRDVVMINLSRAFPDKKYKELKQISNAFYKHFGEVTAETSGSADAAILKGCTGNVWLNIPTWTPWRPRLPRAPGLSS